MLHLQICALTRSEVRLPNMTTGRLPSIEGGIQPTIVDAKGDLIAATAADTPARLAVGANDTVLTADSAEATGLKWATASAPAFNEQVFTSSGTFSVSALGTFGSNVEYLVVAGGGGGGNSHPAAGGGGGTSGTGGLGGGGNAGSTGTTNTGGGGGSGIVLIAYPS